MYTTYRNPTRLDDLTTNGNEELGSHSRKSDWDIQFKQGNFVPVPAQAYEEGRVWGNRARKNYWDPFAVSFIQTPSTFLNPFSGYTIPRPPSRPVIEGSLVALAVAELLFQYPSVYRLDSKDECWYPIESSTAIDDSSETRTLPDSLPESPTFSDFNSGQDSESFESSFFAYPVYPTTTPAARSTTVSTEATIHAHFRAPPTYTPNLTTWTTHDGYDKRGWVTSGSNVREHFGSDEDELHVPSRLHELETRETGRRMWTTTTRTYCGFGSDDDEVYIPV